MKTMRSDPHSLGHFPLQFLSSKESYESLIEAQTTSCGEVVVRSHLTDSHEMPCSFTCARLVCKSCGNDRKRMQSLLTRRKSPMPSGLLSEPIVFFGKAGKSTVSFKAGTSLDCRM